MRNHCSKKLLRAVILCVCVQQSDPTNHGPWWQNLSALSFDEELQAIVSIVSLWFSPFTGRRVFASVLITLTSTPKNCKFPTQIIFRQLRSLKTIFQEKTESKYKQTNCEMMASAVFCHYVLAVNVCYYDVLSTKISFKFFLFIIHSGTLWIFFTSRLFGSLKCSFLYSVNNIKQPSYTTFSQSLCCGCCLLSLDKRITIVVVFFYGMFVLPSIWLVWRPLVWYAHSIWMGFVWMQINRTKIPVRMCMACMARRWNLILSYFEEKFNFIHNISFWLILFEFHFDRLVGVSIMPK